MEKQHNSPCADNPNFIDAFFSKDMSAYEYTMALQKLSPAEQEIIRAHVQKNAEHLRSYLPTGLQEKPWYDHGYGLQCNITDDTAFLTVHHPFLCKFTVDIAGTAKKLLSFCYVSTGTYFLTAHKLSIYSAGYPNSYFEETADYIYYCESQGRSEAMMLSPAPDAVRPTEIFYGQDYNGFKLPPNSGFWLQGDQLILDQPWGLAGRFSCYREQLRYTSPPERKSVGVWSGPRERRQILLWVSQGESELYNPIDKVNNVSHMFVPLQDDDTFYYLDGHFDLYLHLLNVPHQIRCCSLIAPDFDIEYNLVFSVSGKLCDAGWVDSDRFHRAQDELDKYLSRVQICNSAAESTSACTNHTAWKIDWFPSQFDALCLIYERAETNEEIAALLSELETEALQEAKANIHLIQKDGVPLTAEQFDGMTKAEYASVIASLSKEGSYTEITRLSCFEARISSQFPNLMACSIFFLLEDIEYSYANHGGCFPTSSSPKLELQVLPEGCRVLSKYETLIRLLYPQLSVTERTVSSLPKPKMTTCASEHKKDRVTAPAKVPAKEPPVQDMDEQLKRARQLYIQSGFNEFNMEELGTIDEWESYQISKEQKDQWKTEFIDETIEKIGMLNENNFERFDSYRYDLSILKERITLKQLLRILELTYDMGNKLKTPPIEFEGYQFILGIPVLADSHKTPDEAKEALKIYDFILKRIQELLKIRKETPLKNPDNKFSVINREKFIEQLERYILYIQKKQAKLRRELHIQKKQAKLRRELPSGVDVSLAAPVDASVPARSEISTDKQPSQQLTAAENVQSKKESQPVQEASAPAPIEQELAARTSASVPAKPEINAAKQPSQELSAPKKELKPEKEQKAASAITGFFKELADIVIDLWWTLVGIAIILGCIGINNFGHWDIESHPEAIEYLQYSPEMEEGTYFQMTAVSAEIIMYTESTTIKKVEKYSTTYTTHYVYTEITDENGNTVIICDSTTLVETAGMSFSTMEEMYADANNVVNQINASGGITVYGVVQDLQEGNQQSVDMNGYLWEATNAGLDFSVATARYRQALVDSLALAATVENGKKIEVLTGTLPQTITVIDSQVYVHDSGAVVFVIGLVILIIGVSLGILKKHRENARLRAWNEATSRRTAVSADSHVQAHPKTTSNAVLVKPGVSVRLPSPTAQAPKSTPSMAQSKQTNPQKPPSNTSTSKPAASAAPRSTHVPAAPQKSPSNTSTSKPSVTHVDKPRTVQTGRSPIYGTSYSNLADLAYKKVEIIMDLDERITGFGMMRLLCGWGPEYDVKSYQGAPHNYQAVIDAIYEYHRHYPNRETDKVLDRAIDFMIRLYATSLENVDIAYNHLEYIYNKQRKKEASFELNIKGYLPLFKEMALKMANGRPETFSNVNIRDYMEKREQYFM